MSLRIGTLLPTFQGATCWFNGEPIIPSSTSAILVHFWAMSCPACKANLPELQRVQVAYRDSGLFVIAVHMPRGDSDMNIGAVERTVDELGIGESCAIDNSHSIGESFQTKGLWPYYYVFDKERKLRRHAAGANGFMLVERVIERLLPETQ